MIKKLFLPALLLTVVPLLSGCVTDQQFRNLQFNVQNQDNRLVEMEHQLDQVASGGTNASQSMQKQQASIAADIERLSTDILQIKGQLDEAKHVSRSLQEDNLRLQQELDNRLLNLEANFQSNGARIAELKENIRAIKTQMSAEDEQRAQEALRSAQQAQKRAAAAAKAAASAQAATAVTPATPTKELTPRQHKEKKEDAPAAPTVSTAKSPTESPSAPTTDKSPAETVYDRGLGQYRSDDYKGAIKTFTSFLDSHKEHKLLPNARYWLGASLLKNGDYSGAVLEFQNIVADYPGHPKAPDALLQQAKAFEHFGDIMVQKKLYKDVLTYYPDSEQASKAKVLLEKLQ
ncbi:MAG: tol-pal system protein YbgF [Desulfurivibrionaceae bacterium]|nr:tol-pal system protein YbgF [Desulfurivibrionaceae bacterium]